MPTLTADEELQAQQLAATFGEAIAPLLLEAARLLVAKQESHEAFGETEFRLRDLFHKAGARSLETYLGQKKTATSAPG